MLDKFGNPCEKFPYTYELVFLSARDALFGIAMASILFGGAVTLSLASRAIRKQTREHLSNVPKVLLQFRLIVRLLWEIRRLSLPKLFLKRDADSKTCC